MSISHLLAVVNTASTWDTGTFIKIYVCKLQKFIAEVDIAGGPVFKNWGISKNSTCENGMEFRLMS